MGKAIAATSGARATAGNTLRTSNLVRSAHAAYETLCKLESEYPLTVLVTPPLLKSMETRLTVSQNYAHNCLNAYLPIPTSGPIRARGWPRPVAS